MELNLQPASSSSVGEQGNPLSAEEREAIRLEATSRLDEARTESELDEALEHCFSLIFQGDPAEQQEKLGLKKPRVCGKIWSKGGMAYRCHDCEVTSNSCICVECFQAGDHRGHDYSLYSSSYGGCCDCGDPYAWKPEGFCKHHQPQADEDYENNPNRLKVLGIAETVIEVVVAHLRDGLQKALQYSEQRRTLPEFEEVKVHRYAMWIRKACSLGEDLRRIDCDKVSAAKPLESTHSGKTWSQTSFLQGLLRLCCILPRPLEITNMLLDLLYDVAFKVEFARQFVRMYNLLFLHSIDTTKGKRLRNTLSTISAQLFNIEELMILLVKEEGLLEAMLYCALNFFRQMLTPRIDFSTGEPKSQRRSSSPQFSPSPLRRIGSSAPASPSTSDASLAFDSREDVPMEEAAPPRNEGTDQSESVPLLEGEDDDDDEYDESGDEAESDLHDNFPETTGPFADGDFRLQQIEVLRNYEEEDLVFNCSDALTDNDGMMRLFYDIQLTLRYTCVVEYLLWENSGIFLRCLKLLRHMQYMNPNIRQVLTHVEYESTAYQHALFLDARITSQLIEPTVEGYRNVLKKILDSASEGEAQSLVLQKGSSVIEMAAQALQSWLDYSNFSFTTVEVYNEQYSVIDVDREVVSYHLPLHRLLASFVQVIAAFGFENVKFQEVVPESFFEERNLLAMLQHLLQIHVLNAQIRAGHWIRNGEQSMYLQRHYYTTNILLYFQHQMDLFLIQIAAANLRPDHFIVTLLHQFQLEYWFVFNDRARLSSETIPEERYPLIAEDMLRFILVVLLDRSNSASVNWIRKQTIAWLCVNEWTFTELSKKVANLHDPHSHSLLENVLSEVAVPEGRGGKFRLRKELWSEFNPYFLHYSEEHAQQAMERFQQLFPSSPNPPPPYTPTYPMLQDLHYVLDSRLLHSILFCVLYNAATESSRSSESLLDSCLHLLHLVISKSPADDPGIEMDIDFQSSGSERIDTIYDVRFSSGIVAGTLQEFKVNGEMESIVSLLFKISKLKKNRKEPVNAILQLISSKHPRCKEEISKLHPVEVSDEEAKAEARRRRQQILAQFTAKQQSFSASLESAGEYDEDEESQDTLDLSDHRECAICRESSPLNGPRPMGLAALCQRSRLPAIMRERERIVKPEEERMGKEEDDLLTTFKSSGGEGSSQSSPFLRFILNLLNTFSPPQQGGNRESQSHPSPPQAPAAGGSPIQETSPSSGSSSEQKTNNKLYQPLDEGIGLNINTCGHFAHFDCLHQFMETRNNQDAMPTQNEVLLNKTERDWFWCPVCRQLSNILIPLVPSDLVTSEGSHSSFQSWLAEIRNTRPPTRPIQTTELPAPLYNSLRRFAGQIFASVKNTPLAILTAGNSDQEETIVSLLRCLAFNVANLEIGLRGTANEEWFTLSSALGNHHLSPTTSTTLSNVPRALMRAICVYLRFCTSKTVSDRICHSLAGALVPPRPFFKNTIFDMLTREDDSVTSRPLLSLDTFGTLVSWLISRKEAVPPLEEFDYAVKLFFAANIAQALLSIRATSPLPSATPGASALHALYSYLDSLFENSGVGKRAVSSSSPALPRSRSLDQEVQILCLPFLRKVALFQHSCWKVAFPQQEDDRMVDHDESKGKEEETRADPVDEFPALLSYLKLPSIEQLIQTTEIKDRITEWCNDLIQAAKHASSATPSASSTPPAPITAMLLSPPKQFGLVPLPTLFQDLFHSTNGAKCKSCDTSPETPAMCLLCGEIICAYKASCCSVANMGECFRHAVVCGGGSGEFLMLKTSLLLLIRDERCCRWGSPYLDAHKEEDIFLDRGKALYLDPTIYADLAKLFLAHRLDNAILRDGVPSAKAPHPSKFW